MIVSCVFIIVADLFPPQKRGKYTGIVTSMYGLSSIVGPLAGGFVTDHFGWRYVFYMNIPIGLLAFALLFFTMPSFLPFKEKKSADYLGILLTILTLVPFLLLLSMGGENFAWISISSLIMLLVSVVMFAFFLIWEKKVENPMIPLSFFKDRAITISFLIAFFSQILMFAAIMYLPYFVQGIIGSTATVSGLVTVPMMLGLLVASNLSGNLVSKIGRAKWFALGAFFIMGIGAYLLSGMNLTTTNAQVVVFMIVIGFGVGMSMPIANVNAQNAAERQQIGAVTSSVMFFRNMGGTVGSAIMGAIMSASLKKGFLTIHAKYLPQNVRTLLTNPQIISNADTIKKIRSHVPTAYISYFDTTYQKSKEVLALSIQHVFFFGIAVAFVGLMFSMFLRESTQK